MTSNLKQGNIDAATDAKSLLEQRQRREAAARLEAHQRWFPHYFSTEELETSASASTASTASPASPDNASYRFKWPLRERCQSKLTPGFSDAADHFQDATKA